MAAPDTAWVSDITYIETYEGVLYLAVVIDLYSRRVIGWVTQSRQPTDLVLQALLMAVWRRKPQQPVLTHPPELPLVYRRPRSKDTGLWKRTNVEEDIHPTGWQLIAEQSMRS